MTTFRITSLFLGLSLVAGAGLADQFTTVDPPVAITDDSGGTITDCQDIIVPGGTAMISDSPSVEITAEHSWVGDTTFQLTSPATTVVTLMNRPGRTGTGSGNSDNLVTTTPIRFGDNNPSGVSAEDAGAAPCAGDIDGSPDCPNEFIPAPDAADTPHAGVGTGLADFTGEDPVGTWTLCAADSAGGDTGTLTSWSLGFNGMPVPVELQTFSVD